MRSGGVDDDSSSCIIRYKFKDYLRGTVTVDVAITNFLRCAN